MKLEHVLNVQFIQRPDPFTFCSRLNKKYTTVLSLSLSASLIYFWVGNCEGIEVGVWDGNFLPSYNFEAI